MKNYFDYNTTPNKVKKFINNEELKEVYIGESMSQVIHIPNKKAYLKISPSDLSYVAENEYKMYKWLKGKLPVPVVIMYEVTKDHHYMILSEIEGEVMYEADISDIERVTMFAEALKKIHDVDTKGCPIILSTEEVVSRLKYNNIIKRKSLVDRLEYLIQNEPHYEPVLIHGDYAMVNVLVKNNKVSGFIDMSESGVYSKYKDIVHALLDLDYLGYSRYKEHFLKVYGIDIDEDLYDFFLELDFG